jgi:hypothetical protein
MNKLLIALVVGIIGSVALPAAAAENKQNTKMTTCQAQASEKKLEGADRKAFVDNCLKAKPAKSQNKMAECNAKTKGMSKADADKARSECMKAA